MKIFASSLCLLLCLFCAVRAQDMFLLYTGPVPNSRVPADKSPQELPPNGVFSRVTTPTLEAFLPEKFAATATAVIIIPGGSYKVVVYRGEGVATAKEFAKRGVAAFVLKYRLPDDSVMVDKTIGPLQDAQQAIKTIRDNAAKWGVDPHKIGIMGFSAGGHLASTLATHFEKSYIDNSTHTSLRPDFQILIYPVISMQDSLTHRDSRTNLLGPNPTRATIDLFSNELQADKNAPPAYLTHAADDKLVDVDNSIAYFEKLRKSSVPVEMHLYQKGGHGFIFGHPGWMDPLFAWMTSLKL